MFKLIVITTETWRDLERENKTMNTILPLLVKIEHERLIDDLLTWAIYNSKVITDFYLPKCDITNLITIG